MKINIEIVIARYNEPLDWFAETIAAISKEFNVTSYVYNKGNTSDLILQSISKQAQVIQLPNVGRESHTYLHHIIANYERFVQLSFDPSEKHILVFLQGGLSDHLTQWYPGHETPYQLIKAFVIDAVKNQASIKWAGKHEYLQQNSAHYDFRIAFHNGRYLYPRTNMTFGEWFNKNLKPNTMDHTSLLNWWIAAIFAVDSKLLTQGYRTPAFYHSLIDQLNHLDPEVGHFFERSWVYITGANEKLLEASRPQSSELEPSRILSGQECKNCVNITYPRFLGI